MPRAVAGSVQSCQAHAAPRVEVTYAAVERAGLRMTVATDGFTTCAVVAEAAPFGCGPTLAEVAPSAEHGFPVHGVVTLEGADWRRTVEWLDPSYLGSAAFWVEQARLAPRPTSLRMGQTLVEEVALCLLGGYGVNEVTSTYAFWAVRDAGLLDTDRPPTAAEVTSMLQTPMHIPGQPRSVRYRFPTQRGTRVADAVRALAHIEADTKGLPPRELRAALTALNGVGLKTASWVVRNMTRSDDIAVIDVHIRRAGLVAGVFDPSWSLPRDYLRFEEAFCGWARFGGVATADLDLCVWSTLARLGTRARRLFGVRRLADLDA